MPKMHLSNRPEKIAQRVTINCPHCKSRDSVIGELQDHDTLNGPKHYLFECNTCGQSWDEFGYKKRGDQS